MHVDIPNRFQRTGNGEWTEKRGIWTLSGEDRYGAIFIFVVVDVFIFSGCTLVEFMPLYVRMQIHKRLKGMFI